MLPFSVYLQAFVRKLIRICCSLWASVYSLYGASGSHSSLSSTPSACFPLILSSVVWQRCLMSVSFHVSRYDPLSKFDKLRTSLTRVISRLLFVDIMFIISFFSLTGISSAFSEQSTSLKPIMALRGLLISWFIFWKNKLFVCSASSAFIFSNFSFFCKVLFLMMYIAIDTKYTRISTIIRIILHLSFCKTRASVLDNCGPACISVLSSILG